MLPSFNLLFLKKFKYFKISYLINLIFLRYSLIFSYSRDFSSCYFLDAILYKYNKVS